MNFKKLPAITASHIFSGGFLAAVNISADPDIRRQPGRPS